MGNYEQLKQAVSDVIKTNGNQEITGEIMQNTLLSIISTVGSNATFAGIATPGTNPGTPDQNLFYIASENGIYVNFGGAILNNETVVFLNKNGNWVKTDTGIATKENVDFISDSIIASTSLFVSSIYRITTPSDIENFKSNYILNADGTEKKLGNWNLYNVTNDIATYNNPLFVSYDFGKGGLIDKEFLNFALYDKQNKFISGGIVSGKKVFRVPKGYTIKISIAQNSIEKPQQGLEITNDITELQGKNIKYVQTWGNSITQAGKYQIGIAEELNIDSSNVKNFGLSSDFSMHVRNRFISYFTEETPYKGTATYPIPSLEERQNELNNSFFVFWIGTNNLGSFNRKAGTFTTGSERYMALQPNPNFKYDRMYARSYKDMFLNDLRQITSLLKNGNFAIIGGHGGFSTESDARTQMIDVDKTLARMYPRNYVDVRELACMQYNYLDISIIEDFVKPSINNSVQIKISSTNWIGVNGNTSNDICIGTKTIYDRYHVDDIQNDNTINVTLKESKTEFEEGETILSSYKLVSDLGRDMINMQTKVFAYEDCISFNLMSFPRTSSDPIHFTDEEYKEIGKLIAKEIKKIYKEKK